jgi:multisubunit Na+/H+ antiporter MnhC subunit
MQNINGLWTHKTAELEKLVIQHLQHVVMLTVIVINYYMTIFILHVISTRDIHISSRTKGPRTNMSRGLI